MGVDNWAGDAGGSQCEGEGEGEGGGGRVPGRRLWSRVDSRCRWRSWRWLLLWRLEGGLWDGGRCNDPRFMHTPALGLGCYTGVQTCMYLGRLGWIGWWRMRRPGRPWSSAAISTLISTSGLQPEDLQVEGLACLD